MIIFLLVGHHLRVGVLTDLCLSYLCHCSYSFIHFVLEVFSASLPVILVCSCSVNCNFGVPMVGVSSGSSCSTILATLGKECLAIVVSFSQWDISENDTSLDKFLYPGACHLEASFGNSFAMRSPSRHIERLLLRAGVPGQQPHLTSQTLTSTNLRSCEWGHFEHFSYPSISCEAEELSS